MGGLTSGSHVTRLSCLLLGDRDGPWNGHISIPIHVAAHERCFPSWGSHQLIADPQILQGWTIHSPWWTSIKALKHGFHLFSWLTTATRADYKWLTIIKPERYWPQTTMSYWTWLANWCPHRLAHLAHASTWSGPSHEMCLLQRNYLSWYVLFLVSSVSNGEYWLMTVHHGA